MTKKLKLLMLKCKHSMQISISDVGYCAPKISISDGIATSSITAAIQ